MNNTGISKDPIVIQPSCSCTNYSLSEKYTNVPAVISKNNELAVPVVVLTEIQGLMDNDISSFLANMVFQAHFRSFVRNSAVILWARLVLVRFVAVRNELTVPDVATPASNNADVQPEHSKKSPMVCQMAISM